MARAAKHRQQLVETAMRLFREQGFASTGLQQILAESGAPKGSLYYYFPGGKEELGQAAIELAGEKIASMLRRHEAKHPDDPRAFVTGYCKTMAVWMAESDFQSGCPVATTLLETAPRSPAMTETGNRVLDSWIEIIARVFHASGIPPREAKVRGQQLLASVEGALLLARVRQSVRPITDVAKLYGSRLT